MLTDKVKQGSFRVTVVDRGQVDSLKNATITSNVEGTTTIIMIVPEGTRVKEGDIVCELDSATYREQAKQQEIEVTQAEAAAQQAKENVLIQKTQNESDIAAAELAVTLGALDYEKYTKGEYIQEQNTIAGEIELAREKLTRSRENYDFSQRIARKGYRSQSDLEADRIGVREAEIALQVGLEKLKVLNDFTSKRQIAELEANKKELERELVRVKRKAAAALTQFEADYEALKLTAEVERDKYERLKKQVANCVLRAPQQGEVVYVSNQGRRSSEQTVIEEGVQVRERQAIIKLPDVENMKVDARIHESRISRVKVGLPVEIRLESFPGEVFHGVVDDVASVPVPGHWPNTDVKEYETVIRITDDTKKVSRLRPGLTAEAIILVDERADVLQVPIQAVVPVSEGHVAWVVEADGPKMRKLILGDANDTHIEVKDGLNEGDTVVINPRACFPKEITEATGVKKGKGKGKGGKGGKKWQKGPGGKAQGQPGKAKPVLPSEKKTTAEQSPEVAKSQAEPPVAKSQPAAE